jgi:predicted phosphodiesterase
MDQPFAVIADIHGNLLALQAVLADLATRGISLVIDLGDCVSGPLWPAETCERLMALGFPTVRGNHDRWVTDWPADRLGATDRFTRAALTDVHMGWLRALPPAQAFPGILAVHGMPGDDNRYLLERVAAFRLVPDTPQAIATRLGKTPLGKAPQGRASHREASHGEEPQDEAGELVLCGHSHQPRLIRLPDGPTVLNPGSAGCPAYQDPGDDPHVSEVGSPHARYAVVCQSAGAISADLIAVGYDHRAAAARAEACGRSDWAHALATGYALPLPGMT